MEDESNWLVPINDTGESDSASATASACTVGSPESRRRWILLGVTAVTLVAVPVGLWAWAARFCEDRPLSPGFRPGTRTRRHVSDAVWLCGLKLKIALRAD